MVLSAFVRSASGCTRRCLPPAGICTRRSYSRSLPRMRTRPPASDAASGSPGKKMEPPPSSSPPLRIDSALASMPHPDKGEGEDAAFLVDNIAGVFDGVGGWRSQGVDPGLYSRQLAELTKSNIQRGDALTDALDNAHRANKLQGSTTACIAQFEPKGRISVLNVGDSGLLAFRPSEGIYFQTESQQHSFNCPYQLGSNFDDRAQDGRLESVEVQQGDYVVLATDGLLDNLFTTDIEWVIETMIARSQGQVSLKEIADMLAARAQFLAKDDEYYSPFSENAAKEGYRSVGGKLDDITVIVSQILSAAA